MPYKNKNMQAAAAKRHYEKHKKQYLERAKKSKEKAVARNRQFVFNYLKLTKCNDCKESNPIVLEFDHDKSLNKYANIADMINRGNSIARIEEEIKKCTVRCANCHRIKTAKEEDWWIYRAAEEPGSSQAS